MITSIVTIALNILVDYAEILDKRLADPTVIDKTAQAYKYYVHFSGYDKRLDKWVFYDDIIDPMNPNHL